jgi:hypothetical protein
MTKHRPHRRNVEPARPSILDHLDRSVRSKRRAAIATASIARACPDAAWTEAPTPRSPAPPRPPPSGSIPPRLDRQATLRMYGQCGEIVRPAAPRPRRRGGGGGVPGSLKDPGRIFAGRSMRPESQIALRCANGDAPIREPHSSCRAIRVAPDGLQWVVCRRSSSKR